MPRDTTLQKKCFQASRYVPSFSESTGGKHCWTLAYYNTVAETLEGRDHAPDRALNTPVWSCMPRGT